MQTNQPFQKKILLLAFPSWFLLFALLSTSSCKSKVKGTEGVAATDFKMNCVILTKPQVQQWIKKDSANSKNWIKKILLQFYSADGPNAASNMQLIAYPGKDMMDAGSYGSSILSIDTTCAALPLAGPTTFGNNWVDADSLKIFKSNGELEDFDFIRFRPTYEHPQILNFAIEIVRAGKENMVFAKGTNPCPPCQYCNPPNCKPE